ncbi:hypothetical protein ABZS71_06715 [Streptomyces sp. NPDC005393]|uniref:hypothetical protein n=1 Tax=Streptomyces sp. NPDC005393 TaxID=3157041 RepID=UPI0033B0A0F8
MGDLSRIRTAELEDETYFSLWDGVKLLGYRSIAGYGSGYRRVPREMKRRVPWEVFGETGPRARTMTTAVTLDGLKRLVANSSRAAAMNLALELGMETVHVPTSEAEAIRIVGAALAPVEMVEEFKVGDYTVSAYLPTFNIVVEADRMQDHRRDREAEFWRRVIIEDKLGCAFVTFDVEAKDFNPGSVVNRILTMPLPKQAEQSA